MVETERTRRSIIPLGTARGQVHENYIIAQTETGMVIVDQHAAHERLVYEKAQKRQMAENGVAAQALLIPEIVELSAGDCARAIGDWPMRLQKFGLGIEAFGGSAIAVRETPGDPGAQSTPARWCWISWMSWPTRTTAPYPASPDRSDPQPHCLPRLYPVGPLDAGRRDERAAARNGGDPAFRPVQPRTPHLRRTQAGRY